jgi:acetyl-CoA carboxylase biotin carboxylase subunit
VGSDVGLFYDPMLAKLIVWADTRDRAIERMHRALLELTIEGVETSRDFHLRVMEDDEFRAGKISIQWLEQRLDSLIHAKAPPDIERTAAIIGALIAERDRSSPRRTTVGGRSQPTSSETSETPSAWLRVGRQEGLR